MAYITVYYIDFDTKEVISTYDYSLNVGQTQNINVQDHIPAGYLDLFTYNNGNFVYYNSIQVVADEPLYVNGQTGDRFTNNVICFVSATWDGTSNLPIDDLSDAIEGMSVVPVHTSEIAPIDIVDSISITENAMSGQFLTIGDICYPTCSVSLFKGEYTTATVFLKGSEFYVVAQMFGIYQILGKFTVSSEPTIDTDIISLEGSGVLASDGINSVVNLADVMTFERINEILQVQPSLDHIIPASLNNMSYYWYFIVEDIFNLFGIPLIIDNWSYCRETFIAENNIMELLLPSVTISTSADSDGNMVTSTEEEKAITWKDIICNIALLLNCNIVEHGGVIHLKRLPTMSAKAKKFYVGADIYDGNSRFSNNKYWFKSATVKYREYGIRADSVVFAPVNAVFWGNNTRNHKAFTGVPSIWNAGSIEYTTNVNCSYLKPYIWRHVYTNKQIITLLGNKKRAKVMYRSFDIDEDITWEGLNDFNGVPDVVYEPADISFLGWNPLMSIGNCFYCKDYDENNRIIYVGNQTISYSGGVTVSVSSTCNLEDGTSSEYTTSEISSTATGGVANIQSIVNQMLEGVLIRDNALNGTKITDSTITGGKITDATITGSKIANSTITSTQIADSTITNTQIANSTITGSKIVDGTLDGSTKIANATISYAKMDSSFVGNLVADSAFVTELQAEIASFGYITAQQADLDYAQIDFANVANGAIGTALIHDGAITNAKIANATISFAKIDSSFIGSLVADSAFIQDLQAEIATFGYITAQQADLAYMKTTFANMDTANINKTNIGTLFNEVGLITSATIQDGHITGYLDAVEVNANKITAGTLIADRLILTYTQGGVTHYRLLDHFDAQDNPVYTTLNGDTITERTIRANHIVADSITANEIATGTITANEMNVTDLSTISANMGTITAGTLQSDNYVYDTSGMRLTLSNGVWDSKYFKLDATGAITSTAGTIGGWTISSNSIYAGSQSGGITQTVSIDSSIPSINLVHLETGENLNTILSPDSIYIEGRLSNYTANTSLTYDSLGFTQTGGGTVYNSAFTPQIFGMSSQKTGQDVALNMTSKGIRITDNLNGNEFSFDYASGLDFTDGTNAVFGVDIAGNLDCQDLTAFGDISTNGSLEVSTDATIYGPITATGNGTIGGTLNVSGNTTLTGNLSVSGTTTLTGLVSAIGGIDVWGEVEGVTLKINGTSASSFTIAGGGSIGGTLSTSTITSTGAISTTSTISATGDITTSGNVSSATVTTSSTITSTGLITAKGGVDSWGKLEGNTLKINNTGTSSFSILGGGSIAGTLTAPTISLTNGGSITSSQSVVSVSASVLTTSASYMTISNKKVVVDDYSSNFMGFTTATVTKGVPSGTSTMTNLTYVDLTPGVYAVECTAEWDSNSTTGYRHLVLSTSSTGGAVDRFASVTGPAGPSYDRQGFVRLFHLTSNTRFYLNAQQNSGSQITVLGGIQALRLGSN